MRGTADGGYPQVVAACPILAYGLAEQEAISWYWHGWPVLSLSS